MKKILLFLSFLLMSIGVVAETNDVTVQVSSDTWTATGTSGSGSTTSVTKFGISISSNKGYKDGTNHIREYSGCVITVSSSVGTIQTIVFTSTANGTSNYGSAKISPKSGQSGTYSYSGKNGTWSYGSATSNMTSVIFNASAQFRWTQVVVTYNEEGDTYTVTYDANGGTGTMTNGTGESVTIASNGFTAPNECQEFDKWNTETNGSGTYYNPGDVVTSNLTLYAQWKNKINPPLYTVSFNTGGSETQESCGSSITLPDVDVSSACENEGWEFVGWSESNLDYSNLKIESYTPSKDTTLYAVYRKNNGLGVGDYALVEENLDDWSGDYLIAYSSTIFADGRIGGTGPNGMGAAGIFVSPGHYLTGKIVASEWGDAYNITLEAITGGYVMITKDDKYNYQTSNANGLASTDNKTTASAYPLTITFKSSSDIEISISAGVVFHYNEAGYFRFYKNGGQNAIYLYKKQGGYEYSFNPSCCENTVTITKGSEINGIFELDKTEVCGDGSGGSVTVTYEPAEGYEFDYIESTVGDIDGNVVSNITENTTITVHFKKIIVPNIDIVEWNPDFIKVGIENFDGAIKAVIENKNTQKNVENRATKLFFSKYFEAASNIKLWAVYNGTKDTIPLSNVRVLVSSNGGDWTESEAQKVTHLDTLGRIIKGHILPNEEIIVYNEGDKSGSSAEIDTSVMACVKKSYDISSWYMINNYTTKFSGDDGLMLLSGNDTLDIIGIMEPSYFTVGTGKSAKNHSTGTIDNPHGDDYGWYCENGKTIHGDSTTLSTNRCLLIRKNTVHSGDSAVKYNRNDFVTLCSEWIGEVVEKYEGDKSADAAQTCENFAYVGEYDYNAYYAIYEQVGDTIELSSLPHDDGSYQISIPQLDTLSCTYLKVIVTDGSKEAEEEYKIPIFVKTSVNSNNNLFTQESDECPDCDVVVTNNGILTISPDLQNRGVTIYPGGKLIIPSDVTYTVNSLTLRRDNDSVPYLSYNGTLDIKNGMFFEMRTDGSDWRWLTLPDTFMTSEITFSNEISIGQYNGSRRAEQGRNGWEVPTEKNFNPGNGFIFGVDLSGSQKKIYKYELNKGILNITEHTVAVSPYGYDIEPLPPQNDLGWNLIGNPFLDNFVTDDLRSRIKIGKLVKTNTNPWDGKWDVDVTGDLRYIVERCYDNDETIITNGHYKSIRLDDGHMIKPFTSFFVQIPEGIDALVFNKSNLTTSHSPKRITSNNDETFLRINVGELKTGCYISNKFTDEYEANADLGLFENTSLYQIINGYNLVYSAINDSILNNGINVHTNGGVISLDDKTNVSDFGEINIFYNDHYYDLLNGDTPNVQGDFILFAKRNKNDIPTGLNETIIDKGIKKFIYNGNVYIIKENKVYNIFGEKIR